MTVSETKASSGGAGQVPDSWVPVAVESWGMVIRVSRSDVEALIAAQRSWERERNCDRIDHMQEAGDELYAILAAGFRVAPEPVWRVGSTSLTSGGNWLERLPVEGEK